MIETGTLLQDRFVIEEQIGRGGMGAVYIATDLKFGSRVAIKEGLIRPGTRGGLRAGSSPAEHPAPPYPPARF